MSLKETMASLFNKLRQGPVVPVGQEPNMANGGHTGYHPPVPPRQAPQQAAPGGFGGNGYDPNYYMNTGFQQNYAGTSFQNAQPQAAYAQTGWQNQWQGASQPIPPMGQQTGYQPQGTPVQQPQPETPPMEGNVVYPFGQQFKDDEGRAYNHCERLAQPLSVSSCFRLIEFMRNGESIIVNLELVADEKERSRCLDMLYGAAFTMDCTFNRVASRCLYLIAPRTVLVKPYESIREMSQKDFDSRWGAADEPAQPLRTGMRYSSRKSGYTEMNSQYNAY